jgi:Kef-type K+ transport system membrane component KefB
MVLSHFVRWSSHWNLFLPAFHSDPGPSHADPVVPILIASIFITLGAALGGFLMRWMKQPAVLGELLVGLLAGNLGYYLGNPTLTVLREGDNLSRISSLALTSSNTIGDAALKILPPGPHATYLANLLASAQGQTYISVYEFIDIVSRLAILVLLFMVGLEISLAEMKRVGKYPPMLRFSASFCRCSWAWA